MSEHRYKKTRFALWLVISSSLILALLKGIVGVWSGSKALLADAVHSASEAARSIAGLRAAKLQADEDHPYVDGKSRTIAPVVVPVVLMWLGLEIGIASFKSLLDGVDEPPTWYALATIAASVAVKSFHALVVGAWGHRSHLYSSVIAFIGVGGAFLGKLLTLPALYLLDPLAALIVSALSFKMGYRLIKESAHLVSEKGIHEEDAVELVRTVQCVKGVVTVDDLRAREHGHYVVVDVKISVNPKISVMEGHDIAKMVKLQIMRNFPHVSDVLIHVNPYESGYQFKRYPDSDQSDHPQLLH